MLLGFSSHRYTLWVNGSLQTEILDKNRVLGTNTRVDIVIGRGKVARRAYGIDEIALVPGQRTLDPVLADTTWTIGGIQREIPIIASAMDGVVDVRMAVELSKLGALGVLNLEGIQTRYQDPEPILDRIASVGKDEFVTLMQELYAEPIKPELITQRIQEIKAGGGIAAVSATPVGASKYGSVVAEAGADLFFVQATVVSTTFLSPESVTPLDLVKFCQEMPIPVILGNCVTYDVTLDLLKAGAAGILVGIGPGAACTSRGVLGVGVPQATAVADCAAARNDFYQETGRYVPIIADGGLITGGDICKCIACGADGVMIGSPFARAKEAPGRGYHWGMATPSPVLPRGTRIRVGTTGTLEQILRGPAQLDDGTHNLLGALKTSMGTLGAQTIQEMQQVEVVIAPSLLTEGKVYQKAQQLGMGK
jgi:IMP dehydrogenase